jgi:hypothetical protein
MLCDVHVAFIRRHNYTDLKHWCEDESNVYIGRKGIVFCKDCDGTSARFPKQDSIWANPYKPKDFPDIQSCLTAYYTYILGKPNVWDQLQHLKGKQMGCWCVKDMSPSQIQQTANPEEWICHGQVLMYMLNKGEHVS